MKKHIAVILIFAAMLSLFAVGCGGQDAAQNDQTPAEENTIVIGTAGCSPPMEWVDVKSNELVGFDIDGMNAICKEVGLKAEYKVIAFDGLIPALQSKEIDVIDCGLTITDERKESIAFSDPYFKSGDSLMYWDNQKIDTPEDLSGKGAGVQANSSTHYALEEVSKKLESEGKAPIKLKMFKTMSDAIADLQIQGVDAVAIDYPMAVDYLTKNPNATFKLNSPFATCDFGMGLRQDDTELVEKINQGLSAIKESGEYDKLVAKYFPN